METFAVVTACDDKFAQHTSVMLRSLLENNPKTTFRIFVLVPSDFPTNIQSMITNSMPSGRYSFTFIQICYQNLSALKIGGWASHTTYCRLMIADLLPEISRALYLDSDIVVMGDISAMLHLDLSQYPLAAALDPLDASADKRKINLGQSVPYFNAGVMLLNLDRWRLENIGRRALDFATTNPQYIVLWNQWDQCALNNIIRGNLLVLPKEWNFQRADVDFDFASNKSIERAKRAKVLHFTTSEKPWFFMNNHPLKREYWKYLQRTEWKHYVEPDRTLKRMVLKALRSHFPSFFPSVERISVPHEIDEILDLLPPQVTLNVPDHILSLWFPPGPANGVMEGRALSRALSYAQSRACRFAYHGSIGEGVFYKAIPSED